MDPADDTTLPVVDKMQTTVTADSPTTDGVLKVLFQEIINEKLL